MEAIKELTTVMSSEWVEQAELSSEEIQIHTPSSTLQSKVGRSWERVLYKPTVGANLMSSSYAHHYLGNEPVTPQVFITS